MKIFDTPPKSGMPIGHRIFFGALVRMARAWERLSVHNGHVDWSNGVPTIVLDDDDLSRGMTVDYCYVGVKKVTIPPRTSDFLKIYLDGITTPEWVAAMPTGDQDVDSIVIDVTKNRIYLNGETAG